MKDGGRVVSFLNSNGLQNGKIPEQSECPFYEQCTWSTPNCPVSDNLKDNAFSCGIARAFSLITSNSNDAMPSINA